MMHRPFSSARLVMLLALAACLRATSAGAQTQRPDPYAAARNQMVDEDLAREGIVNERVLASMRAVPRHLFLRPDLRRMAYFDQALDIGYKQTISPPYIVAYMTQVLDPQPTDVVLEIGTGSGYQAAVLSGLVQDVYTIEIVDSLGKNAAKLLERLEYKNVHPRVGDGYLGWPEHAPFDKIIVTCSPEQVPQPLIDQLKDGGRLIVPLGERYQQVFHLFEKRDGQLVETKLVPTLFVPMTGKSEELRQEQPDPRRPQIINGGFELSTLEPGKADGWHYQRRSEVVTGGSAEGQRFIRFTNDERGRSAHMLQGLALDGRSIAAVNVSLKIQLTDLGAGEDALQLPGLVLHFYDARRMPIGADRLPPWNSETQTWTAVAGQLAIPRSTQEIIVQVGLNGATGTLSLDEIQLSPVGR